MKLRRLPPLVLLPLAALTACGEDAAEDAPVAATQVAVVDNDFDPAAITIDAGDTVTWTWEGTSSHDVVGDDFASQMQTSGSFEHRFDEHGEFDYVCTVHPAMRGRVVVE